MTTVEDITIPVSGLPEIDSGAPRADVRARLYRPSQTADAGAGSRGMVWAHGGGFVHGDLDMPEADWVARRFADAGWSVLSVDYRLVTDAGQNRFPAAHDDLRAALSWLAAHAARLGVDGERLVLGGASAGGNLAAGVALRAAVTPGDTAPSDLLLAYPVAHAALPAHEPAVASAVEGLPPEHRFLPAAVAAMNLHYVGDGAELNHRFAFPGGHELTGMPRTLIVNAERDDLRSSGEAFARELETAGVDATSVVEPGTIHGHLNVPDDPGASRTITTVLTWLADGDPAHLSRKDPS